jgi:hypothetical protein
LGILYVEMVIDGRHWKLLLLLLVAVLS